MQVIKKGLWVPPRLKALVKNFNPATHLGKLIKEAALLLPDPDMAAELIESVSRMVVIESALYLKIFRANGLVEDLGLVCQKVITNAGVDFLVDAWQNTVELEDMKFHGIGTGSTAEAVGDTALVTELTTEYNPDNTRATGSLTEGASTNIFRTVGTNAVDSAVALREHGIFNQAATGGGTLWDRSVYALINLGNGDSLQSTYDMTATSGG